MSKPPKPADEREALALAVMKLPKPVRFRAQNAIIGFERAIRLIDIDREMASFRAITAEEEAAAALFMALKLRKYPGAEKLNLGNHRHKAALGPFLQAVRQSLGEGPVKSPKMTFDYRAPYLHVHFPLSVLGVKSPEGMDFHVTLEEPLHVHSQNPSRDGPYLFEKEIEQVATASDFTSIERLVAQQANSRNTLLYASDSGLPVSRATLETITARRNQAELALFLAIAILQTKTLQSLALRALEAFLGVVGQKLDGPMPYPAEPDPDVEIKVNRDGPAQVTFTPSPKRATGKPASRPAGRR